MDKKTINKQYKSFTMEDIKSFREEAIKYGKSEDYVCALSDLLVLMTDNQDDIFRKVYRISIVGKETNCCNIRDRIAILTNLVTRNSVYCSDTKTLTFYIDVYYATDMSNLDYELKSEIMSTMISDVVSSIKYDVLHHRSVDVFDTTKY